MYTVVFVRIIIWIPGTNVGNAMHLLVLKPLVWPFRYLLYDHISNSMFHPFPSFSGDNQMMEPHPPETIPLELRDLRICADLIQLRQGLHWMGCFMLMAALHHKNPWVRTLYRTPGPSWYVEFFLAFLVNFPMGRKHTFQNLFCHFRSLFTVMNTVKRVQKSSKLFFFNKNNPVSKTKNPTNPQATNPQNNHPVVFLLQAFQVGRHLGLRPFRDSGNLTPENNWNLLKVSMVQMMKISFWVLHFWGHLL